MQSSHSLHDMRDLLRCGAPVYSERVHPAPVPPVPREVPTPDNWMVETAPGGLQLLADLNRFHMARDNLRRACWGLDNICTYVVKPERQTNLQWTILDVVMSHVQVPIHRVLTEINDTRAFFQNRLLNRTFYVDQGRLEAKHQVLADLLRDAQTILQQRYIETGIYTAEHTVISEALPRGRKTEKELWDFFCLRIDSL